MTKIIIKKSLGFKVTTTSFIYEGGWMDQWKRIKGNELEVTEGLKIYNGTRPRVGILTREKDYSSVGLE